MSRLQPLALSALLLSSCAHAVHRYTDAPVTWVDTDENHVELRPDEYWSGLAWDGIDQSLFRPVQRALRLSTVQQAANVNAWDEVPDSSWFRNRIGVRRMSHAELAQGSCPDNILDTAGPWTVTAAKPNGANPGFIIKGPEGRGWLLKFDGLKQPDRATTADVLGSRLYHAAGYFAPCNVIVYFNPSIITINPNAEAKDDGGKVRPLVQADIDTVLASAGTRPDGLLRASASLYLPGRPIGPWTYQGTRRDDPNDVIKHENRRELRGAKLMAAWTNHFDAREQNTLAIWVEEGDRTFVRHYYLDFGDTLGSIWWWTSIDMSKRFGYSYYVDATHFATDYATLGTKRRPWNQLSISDDAPVGFFTDTPFDPTKYKTGYPNPSFLNMQPEDGAWAARILSRIDGPALQAMLDEGQMQNVDHEAEIFRLLMSRRQSILDVYLRQRSPLADFTLEEDQLCFVDLAVTTNVIHSTTYTWTAYQAPFKVSAGEGNIAGYCTSLSDFPKAADGYLIVDLGSQPTGEAALPPARLHMLTLEGETRLVGIERPGSSRAPGR